MSGKPGAESIDRGLKKDRRDEWLKYHKMNGLNTIKRKYKK
jgi:hypothetical protein